MVDTMISDCKWDYRMLIERRLHTATGGLISCSSQYFVAARAGAGQNLLSYPTKEKLKIQYYINEGSHDLLGKIVDLAGKTTKLRDYIVPSYTGVKMIRINHRGKVLH